MVINRAEVSKLEARAHLLRRPVEYIGLVTNLEEEKEEEKKCSLVSV